MLNVFLPIGAVGVDQDASLSWPTPSELALERGHSVVVPQHEREDQRRGQNEDRKAEHKAADLRRLAAERALLS